MVYVRRWGDKYLKKYNKTILIVSIVQGHQDLSKSVILKVYLADLFIY